MKAHPRRVTVIYNPASGAGAARREIPLMLHSLHDMGMEVDQHRTEAVGDATKVSRQAVASGADLVCVIGGDGTVNEAINGVAATEVPLAIVPTGTVNILAMELGIPLDPPDALKLLATGDVSWIDLGLAGERYFALMAGIGLDAAVVGSMNPILKRTLKEAAFAVHGLATYLTKEEPLLRIETPERTVEGYFVVLGNSPNYGGAFGITPLADMRDGLLDVCVLKDKRFLSVMWYWLAALINSHTHHPAVEYFRTESAYISAVDEGAEVGVQTDGEVAGRVPLECRVVPRALRVIVP
jgi:diacylglycerol kinase (ATP)